MQKNVFIVDAYLLTSEGVFSHFQGYPQSFDSDSYNGNIAKALKRATGAFATAWANCCANDDRLTQSVTLTDINGVQIDKKCVVATPADPEQEETTTEE